VVPKQGRENLLALLHEGHPGISKMKGLAHSYVWWPNIDAESDLEVQVKQCNQCQANQPFPPATPMHPWEWPDTHGREFTWTMLDLFQERCFWLLRIPILNGWK